MLCQSTATLQDFYMEVVVFPACLSHSRVVYMCVYVCVCVCACVCVMGGSVCASCMSVCVCVTLEVAIYVCICVCVCVCVCVCDVMEFVRIRRQPISTLVSDTPLFS